MILFLRRLAPALGFTLLAACASNDLVVVLPAADGHIGGVVVQHGDSKILLDKAYAAAGDDAKPVTVDPKEIDQIFGKTLAARPIPPKDYTLYFMADSNELVPDSRAAFEDVFAEIARRKASEIVVTGHTDTMGAPDYNDKLSLARAKSVSKLFVDRGLKPDSVIAVGRGQRELLVPTKDQVAEPRNRRVEITVR
ncbi:MAG TPA: OmpA family protein [Aliidongia sp.]|uniref:OmpA family protein n=1 Tax=Aliidongia sp. TaxID=1914230 RepID=UPI002DDD7C21|nr:OmpA family protein [Aliidongia sp.]HEV2673140.1 OmpA family protein [Aliidongia sp.]